MAQQQKTLHRNRAQRRRAGQMGEGGLYFPRTSPRTPAERHPMAMPLNEYGELIRGRRQAVTP